MLTELEVLKDVTQRFERKAIDYMLTGSVAMNYYTEPRMTRDIDLVVALQPEDADRIRSLFRPDYYVPDDELDRAFAASGMFNLVHVESVVKIDVILRKENPYRRIEFDRRLRISLPDFDTWIVSKEDLILSKLYWAKDSRSEMQLRDVRNLLTTGANRQYLSEWAAILGVDRLLQEAAHE
ncbi:MAG TPA: nucleotidyl transferase AbiEii/AbiGii toxin family protein [Burkholderiales bacterium]|nr:nucleotidyl transferase AbiEii/AbiGii toxin family protein [Burkholderiales bacterium]